MRTIETILLLPILSLILSCSYNDKQVDLAITKAEELLDVSPDSSLAILDKVDSLKTKWRTSQQMRYELVRAQAQNKAYINFSTDSVLLEVVDYYDTHGTANERMTARYMLGCAYRDMEDAPRALECFIDATEQADTTSADCDYNTLFRIYAQIGDLYQHQDMPDMAQEAHRRFSEYALKAGDIYHYIRGKENKNVEFGAKCNNILIDGISFIEKVSFNAFNEGTRLKHCISLAQKLTGVPVKKVGGDQGYSGNANRTFCKDNNIETSFTQKGKAGTNEVKNATKRELARVRAIAMEGSFGTQKEHYGLRKIAARIKSTEIMLIFFGIHTANVVNLARRESIQLPLTA